MAYIFNIYGEPLVQKQTRFANGRAYDPSKRDKERIQWAVKPFAPDSPILGPIELTIMFFMRIPKATSGIRRKQMLNRLILPIKRPDADNLAYLVTNALKEIVYRDDSQVVAQHIYKVYGAEPKTVIQVREISTLEKVGLDLCELG
jgi:Holliday junction resolvase RusA-like endonuclease